jgi:hypothetical protein
MKKKTKTSLIKKADKLWSEIIKLQAKGKCEVCGKTESLNSHHIFSRSNMRMRHNLENGVCACVSHHVWGSFSAHKSPVEFVEFIKKQRGNGWYEKLRTHYQDPPYPLTIQYYENIITGLQELKKQFE